MPVLQPQSAIITLEEYETLPEDIRAEVFDGQIYYMASPSQDHQTLSMELSNILYNYIKNHKDTCRVFHAPFDVKLSDKPLTIVQPDIMIICDKDKLDGKRCNGAPDWIIEIVSPGSRRMDYYTKLSLYRSANVREYWIVDPIKQTTLVYDMEHDSAPAIYSFSDSIKANIYDDLWIDFQKLDL